MGIIEQHIRETQEIIEQKDYKRAEMQYDTLFSLYKDKIDGYENGTTVLRSKTNAIWNLNDGINLPTDVDYIHDLSLVLKKITMYNQELDNNSTPHQTIYNSIHNTGTIKLKDGSINIGNNGNSGVLEPTSPKKKPSVWGIIGWIIAALSGIATIVALILQICGVI